jgi:hypothetical protein
MVRTSGGFQMEPIKGIALPKRSCAPEVHVLPAQYKCSAQEPTLCAFLMVFFLSITRLERVNPRTHTNPLLACGLLEVNLTFSASFPVYRDSTDLLA